MDEPLSIPSTGRGHSGVCAETLRLDDGGCVVGRFRSGRPLIFGTMPCRRDFDVRQTESQNYSRGLGYSFDFGGDGDL